MSQTWEVLRETWLLHRGSCTQCQAAVTAGTTEQVAERCCDEGKTLYLDFIQGVETRPSEEEG